jgi:hypothetical protein
LETWNAPEAMKRIWSVLTGPYFVATVVPSMRGRKVALHALARGTAHDSAALAGGDLVDLVDEDDAVVLDEVDRLALQLLLVEELVGFLGDEDLVRVLDLHLALDAALPEGLAEHVGEVDHADIAARHAGNVEHGRAGIGRHLDLDLLVVELAAPQLLAERIARRGRRRMADERVDHPFLRVLVRLRLDIAPPLVAQHRDAGLDEVAHDLLDVAAHIADLGELGGLDLDEGRLRELGEPTRDLGLADAGRPDHQDVLGGHFLTQLRRELLAAPAVPQRHRDGALGVLLADDVAVELGNDLARGKIGFTHSCLLSRCLAVGPGASG